MTRDQHAARAEALARRAELLAQRAEQRLRRRNEHAARTYAERSRREERSDARRVRRHDVVKAADRRVNQQVLGAVLLAIGGNWLLAELGLFTFGWPGLFAVALMTLGIAMVSTAKAGRTKPLVALGILLTFGLAMSSGVSNPVRGQSLGDQTYAPISADLVRENYDLDVGELTVDLTNVTFPDGLREINAEVGVGELRVLLPADVAVEIAAEVGAGQITILNSVSQDGIGVDQTYRDENFNEAAARLELDLEIKGPGEIVVERQR